MLCSPEGSSPSCIVSGYSETAQNTAKLLLTPGHMKKRSLLVISSCFSLAQIFQPLAANADTIPTLPANYAVFSAQAGALFVSLSLTGDAFTLKGSFGVPGFHPIGVTLPYGSYYLPLRTWQMSPSTCPESWRCR